MENWIRLIGEYGRSVDRNSVVGQGIRGRLREQGAPGGDGGKKGA